MIPVGREGSVSFPPARRMLGTRSSRITRDGAFVRSSRRWLLLCLLQCPDDLALDRLEVDAKELACRFHLLGVPPPSLEQRVLHPQLEANSTQFAPVHPPP